MEIKLNDVYSFQWNEKYYKEHHDPNWCFDGQLIVRQRENGELYLADTYWGSCHNGKWGLDGSSKTFMLEKLLKLGTLKFKCNLDDIELIERWELDYYDDKDLFDLSYQHRCYPRYFKRKCAEKSIEKMERVLKNKIESTERVIKCDTDELQRLKDKLEKVQNGDIEIYI